jgi:Xaa-Pro aminopeptidase
MTWSIYSDEITDREKLWGTERLSHTEIVQKSGIEDIRERHYFQSDIKALADTSEKIHIRSVDTGDIFHGFGKYSAKYVLLEPFLAKLRLIKLPEEIEKIRQAISITHEAYRTIRDFIKPGIYEYEIEAEIARVFRAHHATEAYPTIVASGVNACTLHYTKHSRKIES